MERLAGTAVRRDRQAEEESRSFPPHLDVAALRQTPGFMVRILQVQIFERFYASFAVLGISPPEYAILLAVRDNDAITQSELAAVLKMRLPNLIKLLTLMEERGTMRRRRSAKDRRAVELSLTSAGRKRAEEASRLGEQFDAETLGGLGKQEQAAFLRAIGRLVDSQPGVPT